MKLSKKRIVSLIICLVFIAAAMAGCNGGETGSDQDGADKGKSSEPVKLTFWTFQNAHQEFMVKAQDEWNAANPESMIELEVGVYSYDDNHNNLLIALQSGTGAPDIVDIEIGRFANYLKGTPQLVPLNDVIEPIKDKLVMSRFDNYAKDGQYYGIDYHVGIPVIYYNTEICDQAGIDIDAIITWEDYIEAGKQVVEKTGIPMTTLEVTEHWSYYPIITQTGSDFLDSEGNPTLNDSRNVEVLQMLYDMMYTDEIAVAAPGGFHHAEEYYGFMNDGGAASVWMPQWYMNRFTDYMVDLDGKVAIRPLPVWEEGGIYGAGMGGTGTVITNQCENQDIAKEFLAFAKMSEEGAGNTWTDLGFDPIRWDVWSSDVMKADNKFTDYYGKDVFSMLEPLKDRLVSINISEKFPNAQTLVQSSVVFKVLSEQSMTPQEACDAAQEELENQ